MSLEANQAIGIFDSGVGGLTVASAIKNILPNETIIYFGDTAHLPYGDKSAKSIQYYSNQISEFLLKKDCKIILIACNTASAYAYEEVKKTVANRAIVLNVIEPVITYIATNFSYRKIGVIGTKGTINSGIYPQKLKQQKPDLEVTSLAAALFVPMVEEGFIYDDISNAIIRSYLSNEKLANIEALILGCTHYPIIKNQIRKFYDFRVNVIDSASVVARNLLQVLKKENLLCTTCTNNSQFYISDHTEYFEKIARIFFEDDLNLQKIDFWK